MIQNIYARPHPGPLPRGEGETLSHFSTTACLSTQFSYERFGRRLMRLYYGRHVAAVEAHPGGLIAAEAAEVFFGQSHPARGERDGGPLAAQWLRSERTHFERLADQFVFHRPRREDRDTEVEFQQFDDSADAVDFHGHVGDDLELVEMVVDYFGGDAGALVDDELLGADIIARDGSTVRPRVGSGENEHEFVAKDVAYFEAVGIFRRDGKSEVDFVSAQQFQRARGIAGFDA